MIKQLSIKIVKKNVELMIILRMTKIKIKKIFDIGLFSWGFY